MIITRIDRRVVPCEDYNPEDLCECGRALGTHAAVIDTLTAEDNWVSGEFICGRCDPCRPKPAA